MSIGGRYAVAVRRALAPRQGSPLVHRSTGVWPGQSDTRDRNPARRSRSSHAGALRRIGAAAAGSAGCSFGVVERHAEGGGVVRKQRDGQPLKTFGERLKAASHEFAELKWPGRRRTRTRRPRAHCVLTSRRRWSPHPAVNWPPSLSSAIRARPGWVPRCAQARGADLIRVSQPNCSPGTRRMSPRSAGCRNEDRPSCGTRGGLGEFEFRGSLR
jgi:hypothetical protein